MTLPADAQAGAATFTASLESLYGVVVKQREHDLPRLSTLRPGLPRPLVAAIEGCLHKAPGDRWQTIRLFNYPLRLE